MAMATRMASSTSSLCSSSHMALPAHVQPRTPTPTATPTPPHAGSQSRNTQSNGSMRRGHIRSASLENANPFASSKNTLGQPHTMTSSVTAVSSSATLAALPLNHTGTLKSRNEQKRLRNKFGSHNNLEESVQPSRSKFQNIRQMFELTRGCTGGKSNQQDKATAQSLPPTLSGVAGGATAAPTTTSYKQKAMPLPQSPRKPPALTAATKREGAALGACGNRNSMAELSDRLNGMESESSPRHHRQLQSSEAQPPPQPNHGHAQPLAQPHSQPHPQTQAQPQRQHLQQQQQQQQQQKQQQHQQYKQTLLQLQYPQQAQQRSVSDLAHLLSDAGENDDQATNLLRPIAFKPIPFEPDYSIPSRYCSVDHYGSTPSLAPVQGSSMRFGSTTDLRHGGGGGGSGVGVGVGVGVAIGMSTSMGLGTGGAFNGHTSGNSAGSHCGSGSVGVGVGVGGLIGAGGVGMVASHSSNNYCNSLMARRRGSRSLKINDSMESIRHTPDSDTHSQSSTLKANANANQHNHSHSHNHSSHSQSSVGVSIGGGNGSGCGKSNFHQPHQRQHSSSGSSTSNNNAHSHNGLGGGTNNKYMGSEQCDMTPSPSDSGISELEAALKDRDSELSYLRQAMEHNENDKETFWENETRRLKGFYETQQREFVLKMKKMEQMLAMQQFQFKQHKMKHNEQICRLKEHLSELKHENEIFKSNNSSLKNSERNLKDRVAYIEEQLRESQLAIEGARQQLEESEWKVCERNGEIALLKTQLKEANSEITMKEHAIVHLKQEHSSAETQIYQSLQEQNQKEDIARNQQHATQTQRTEVELKQLNKIIILKDQVILALTNELAKLRKELSDLAISHEYGEEPSGKFIRLKHQLDNLTDICNKTRQHAQMTAEQAPTAAAKEKVIDDMNLELIMNCLKIAPSLSDDDLESVSASSGCSANGGSGIASGTASDEQQFTAERRLAKMSAEIQKFVYGSQNLPDVAVSSKSNLLKLGHDLNEATTLDTLIEESAGYAEEIAKLRKQLDEVRVNFELEKQQWSEEKEKVLRYQKQLQSHYISMYQKLRNLERNTEL